jgi:hypothetical protein
MIEHGTVDLLRNPFASGHGFSRSFGIANIYMERHPPFCQKSANMGQTVSTTFIGQFYILHDTESEGGLA